MVIHHYPHALLPWEVPKVILLVESHFGSTLSNEPRRVPFLCPLSFTNIDVIILLANRFQKRLFPVETIRDCLHERIDSPGRALFSHSFARKTRYVEYYNIIIFSNTYCFARSRNDRGTALWWTVRKRTNIPEVFLRDGILHADSSQERKKTKKRRRSTKRR